MWDLDLTDVIPLPGQGYLGGMELTLGKIQGLHLLAILQNATGNSVTLTAGFDSFAGFRKNIAKELETKLS